jgi:hypothetical protein
MALVRINFNSYEDGEEYRFRLIEEAERNFRVILKLLSSFWQSTVDGPAYARELKAVSFELARIRLSLEDIRTDQTWTSTRGEFLYQVLTTVLFPPGTDSPGAGMSDVEFRDMLVKVVDIYFSGSVPQSMKRAVELFVKGEVRVSQNFLEARRPGSGFDISDQFGFGVDVMLDSPGSTDVFLADRNIRILLDVIRPAHTLYRLRYVLRDEYLGQQDPSRGFFGKVQDDVSMDLENYGYEDFRKFVGGVAGVDRLGFEKSVDVVGEDHSDEWDP